MKPHVKSGSNGSFGMHMLHSYLERCGTISDADEHWSFDFVKKFDEMLTSRFDQRSDIGNVSEGCM